MLRTASTLIDAICNLLTLMLQVQGISYDVLIESNVMINLLLVLHIIQCNMIVEHVEVNRHVIKKKATSLYKLKKKSF